MTARPLIPLTGILEVARTRLACSDGHAFDAALRAGGFAVNPHGFCKLRLACLIEAREQAHRNGQYRVDYIAQAAANMRFVLDGTYAAPPAPTADPVAPDTTDPPPPAHG